MNQTSECHHPFCPAEKSASTGSSAVKLSIMHREQKMSLFSDVLENTMNGINYRTYLNERVLTCITIFTFHNILTRICLFMMSCRSLNRIYERLKVNLPRLVEELEISDEFAEQVFSSLLSTLLSTSHN